MHNLWLSTPAPWQTVILGLALLLPVAVLAVVIGRGHAPGLLVRALLWRFFWVNLVFVTLIALSVGLGVGILAQDRALRAGLARAADKFDLIVAAPGNPQDLMLATVYLQPRSAPLLDGAQFDQIARAPRVRLAAPIAFGDSWQGIPVVGTTAEFVMHLTDGAMAGRLWQSEGEAIVGAAVPLQIGDSFEPAHGRGAAAVEGAHAGLTHDIVGRMARTGSPWDRAILVPVEGVWSTHGLANGHAPDSPTQLGPPFDPDYFPGTPSVIISAESLSAAYTLRAQFNRPGQTMAFFPATLLADLYGLMGDARQVLSILSVVTQGVVAVSVLMGIVLLTRLFQRHMALLRALGAPRRFILAVVWGYAVCLLAAGTLAGVAAGYGAAWGLSHWITVQTDILVRSSLGGAEWVAAIAFFAAMTLLSLLPAWVILRQPVQANLRG